jgi:hypothetical protein
MLEGEWWNVAVAEFEVDGGYATVTCGAATADDDAIQNIVDALAQHGIRGERVVRLYSERKPSDQWYKYFAVHWPRAAVTWSFGPGEEAQFEAAIEKLRSSTSKPWWKFW